MSHIGLILKTKLAKSLWLWLCLGVLLYNIPKAHAGGPIKLFGGDPAKLRQAEVIGAEGAIFAITIYALDRIWYRQYPKSKFHIFNDNGEWLQMDKLGHMIPSYYLSRLGSQTMQWAGVPRKESVIYGAGLSLLFMTTLEVKDGYSVGWGFSYGDMIANVSGNLLYSAQELGWKQQRITPQFSYHFSIYSQYRPNILGKTFFERLLKDYNGQTYWLSTNPTLFNPKLNFPSWFNITLGYNAYGMTGGTVNADTDSYGKPLPVFKRTRRYLLSAYPVVERIFPNTYFLGSILDPLVIFTTPAPALEFTRPNGLRFRALYY